MANKTAARQLEVFQGKVLGFGARNTGMMLIGGIFFFFLY
jgi:hypothetical protein